MKHNKYQRKESNGTKSMVPSKQIHFRGDAGIIQKIESACEYLIVNGEKLTPNDFYRILGKHWLYKRGYLSEPPVNIQAIREVTPEDLEMTQERFNIEVRKAQLQRACAIF